MYSALHVAWGMLECRQFGRPKEGIRVGPIKFSRTAELVNARAAMVGYAILMYIGYNTVSACTRTASLMAVGCESLQW